MMTFDNALSHAIDYGKFIVQLWNYYILLVVAMIGWLVTLRSKPSDLELRTRKVLIVSFGVISVVFGVVLEQNQFELIRLSKLVHEFAQVDTNSKILTKFYGPAVDNRLVWTLHLSSRLVLPVVAILVGRFMWLITDPPPRTSFPGSGKTES